MKNTENNIRILQEACDELKKSMSLRGKSPASNIDYLLVLEGILSVLSDLSEGKK